MNSLRALLTAALLAAAPAAAGQDWVGTVPAPDFPGGLDWLNTDAPLSLEDLRGRIVLLDFWTYGCINCIHVIPELERLQREYADVLTVIGVHSAKFTNEADTGNIRLIADRYGRSEPIVNDAGFDVWRSYGMNAWPGFILIDPEGDIVGRHSGEGIYDLFADVIENMIPVFEFRGTLEPGALEFRTGAEARVRTALRFPGRVLADPDGGRLFVSDTANNRVVVTDLSGTVLEVVGSGTPDLRDGPFREAAFRDPQGLTLDPEGRLYVADTGNHSLRLIDFGAGTVETVAGHGQQEYMFGLREADGRTHGLNSPWDVLFEDGNVFVAMAGQHQLWRFDPETARLHLHAGSGREVLSDGALQKGGLNQPSGLDTDGTVLFVADAEASAIRSANISAQGDLHTIVGTGLFDFGDVDGQGREVRLQHPLDVAWDGSGVWIADTYNHSIKYLDPETATVTRIFGNGTAGAADGPGAEAMFHEPGGLSLAGGLLYIADTNNHVIRVADPAGGTVSTLTLSDPEALLSAGRRLSDDAFDEVIRTEEAELTRDGATLEFRLSLPPGYVANHLSPLTAEIRADGGAVTIGTEQQQLQTPEYPLTIATDVSAAEPLDTEITADLSVYYCEEEARQVCLIRQVRFILPVTFGSGPELPARLAVSWTAPELP